MKKILMLASELRPCDGGQAQYASQIALAANTLGHRVTVVAPDFGEDCQNSDKETYPFRIIRYDAGIYSRKQLVPLLYRTWRFAQPGEYDIIHATDWPYAMALAFVNKVKHIPFVTTVYGTELFGLPDSRHAKYLFVKDLFDKAQQIFAISAFTRSLLLEQYPNISPTKVIVTPLGVDSHNCDQNDEKQNIRKTYSISENHKIILTVSRLDEIKGHRSVLKALAKLPPEMKQNITYVIIGGGSSESYKQELSHLCEKCGVRVIFTGWVSERQLTSFYRTAAIFCMPGEPHPEKIEGFGLVYLEAAICGLPAIASKLGGVPEVVLHNKTGLLIEPLDISALAEAILRLLTDEPYRKELGANAQNYAKTLSWQKCALQTYGR